ncbi:MAG: CotH kinase family protein [Lewinellaceae bacterium]|nr:CotH kinase family protein [Lewinellaceae bacterium]
MRFILLLLLSLVLSPAGFSQTFTATGGPIPDDGTYVVFDLAVTGLPTAIDTQGFGLESVCLNIVHTWSADVSVSLMAPDSTLIPLFSGVGGDTDGFLNTCLDGNATESLYQVWYPFTGTFRPLGDLGRVNNGQDPNGTWRLVILDTYAFADSGDLLDWSLTFGANPSAPFPFESSDLPVIQILTSGKLIQDEPKVDVWMEVYDQGSGIRNYPFTDVPSFSGPIGAEYHGNSTQSFPKKNIRIETRDSLGKDLDVVLLNLPATSDYVLLANFSDKTLLRNALTYDLSRDLGHYAARTRFCELLIDGTYQGVYLLTEKIKRGAERLDIPKITPADTLGVDLTGGYIVKIDWNSSPGWNSQFAQPGYPGHFTYFQHEYPKWDQMLPIQQNYIRSYVDSFEMALASPNFQHPQLGWRRFGDEESFMDFLFVNEMSRNVDGYRLSTYFYKQRDDKGGKLRMGPVWDFDLAWFNADYCEAWLTSGWAYNINEVCGDAGIPYWWDRLELDTMFQQNLACRWQNLREDKLSTAAVFTKIDSMATLIGEAQQRNFKYWDILGIYIWPNPQPLPPTYAGEIQKLKVWTAARLDWMDSAFSQNFPVLDAGFTTFELNATQWGFESASNPAWNYHWDFGDGQSEVGGFVTHDYATTGSYTVTLTVSSPFGCTEQSGQQIQVINTSTIEPKANGLLLFPNPVLDHLLVEVPKSMKMPSDWQIINQFGQPLNLPFQRTGPGWRVETSALPVGVYWVVCNAGGVLLKARFVKI